MAGSFLTATQKCQTSGQDQWRSMSQGCELHPQDGQGRCLETGLLLDAST